MRSWLRHLRTWWWAFLNGARTLMPTTIIQTLARFSSGVNCLKARAVRSQVSRKVAAILRARPLVAGRSVLGKDDGLDIPAYSEISDHAHPARGEQLNQVIQDSVGC